MSKRRTSNKTSMGRTAVDLDLIACLDENHSWRLVECRNDVSGQRHAERVKMCMKCSSLKVELTTWYGQVIGRRYDTDKRYLEECKKLEGDTIHERRWDLRRRLIEEGR